jgi:hypothetical protein
MNSTQAVLTIYLLTLATGLGALFLYPLWDLATWLTPGVVLLQVACVLGVVSVLEAAGRKGANGKTPPESRPQA